MKNYKIEDIEDYIIFKCIVGSRAYGTNVETSDTDIKGVFIQPLEDIFSFGKIQQVSNETNDITYYEIERFLELLKTTNPNICELLYSPEDCILYKDPIFDDILENRDKFLTKCAKNSFGGYAYSQIKKSQGLNKKINWEESKIQRKTVLDFCYIILNDGKSKSFKEWLTIYNDKHYIEKNKNNKFTQFDFGLAAINHTRDTYALYDMMYHNTNKFSGIVSNEETSNDVQLTSIPKGLEPCAILVFNKDGYSSHCKKYKEYQEWLRKRNINRFKMNKQHGKNYDSKNLLHLIRLLNVSKEILEGKGVIVRRNPDEIKKLLSIRKGEYEYDDILKDADNLMKEIDEIYKISSLPESVDENFINGLLLNIRFRYYNL